jgi:hypothetical protein
MLSFKRGSLAVFYVVGILVVLYVGLQYLDLPKNIPNTLQSSPVSTSEVNYAQVYKSSTWNFTLSFPSTWKGYQVTEHDWTSNPNRSYTADICFYFERPESIPACILQISVFSAKEWAEDQKNVGKQSKNVYKSNGYFFTYSDYDGLCAQLDEFQCDRQKEIEQIFKTLKFL